VEGEEILQVTVEVTGEIRRAEAAEIQEILEQGIIILTALVLGRVVNQDLATAVVAAVAAAAVTSVVQDKGCKQTGLEAEDLRVVFLLKEPFFQWEVVLR